jgi:hypothetical protein
MKVKMMYKQVETAKQLTLMNGVICQPLATLKSSGGGVAHIIEDDHCLVAVIERDYNASPDVGGTVERRGVYTYYWFPELLDVAKTLPTPTPA